MLFVSCSVGRQRNPLVLVLKKNVALQARQPSPGIAPISSGSGASMTASPAGRALPTMAPMPSAGRVDTGAQGMASEVAEQQAMAVILLPTMGGWGC